MTTQTRIIILLMIVIFLPVLLVCVVALAIGVQHPTQLITALTQSKRQFTVFNRISIFDMNRNLTIYIPLPDDFINEIPLVNFSPNGRRIIMLHDFINTTIDVPMTLIVWDVFSGEATYIETPDCTKINTIPKWTLDNQQVLFICFSDTSAGLYLFDFATRQLTDASIPTRYSSPDGRYLVRDGDSGIVIFDANGGNEQIITPPNVWRGFIAWEGDGEFFLFRDIDTIQRYTPATQSLEVLTEGIKFYGDKLILSPDDQWLAMLTGLSKPRAHTLHLPTTTFYHITAFDNTPIVDGWIGWSPDSQWLFVSGYDGSNNLYYVIKPDASVVQILHEEPVSGQIYLNEPSWSTDSQWLVFTTYTNNYLYVWRRDDAQGRYNLFKSIENNVGKIAWSQNYDKLMFIDIRLDQSRLAYLDMATGEIRFISSPLEIVGDYRLVE